MRNKSCEDEGVTTAFSSEGASIRANGNVTTGTGTGQVNQAGGSLNEKGQISWFVERKMAKGMF